MQVVSQFLFEKRDKVRDKIRDEYLVDTFENLKECSAIELRGLLKTYRQRHCEGDSPKQSIDSLYSGLLHFVRNDEKMRFLEVPLNGKLSKAMPNCRSSYEYSSIFKPVDGKKVAQRIKDFNPKFIREFQIFLHDRYYPEERFTNGVLFPYHKEDLPCLEKLLAELPKRLKKSEPLKNSAIMNLVNEIEKILEKVKKINAVN